MPTRLAAVAVLALTTGALAVPATAARDRGRATCGHQSSASFPGAYSDRGNLHIGPLVLVGGRRYSSPETVREFGGQKYPAVPSRSGPASSSPPPRAA
jgi:hypothetical protein